MNEKWTDFEKHVFKELTSISARLSKLEGRVIALGALSGAVVSALLKALFHS